MLPLLHSTDFLLLPWKCHALFRLKTFANIPSAWNTLFHWPLVGNFFSFFKLWFLQQNKRPSLRAPELGQVSCYMDVEQPMCFPLSTYHSSYLRHYVICLRPETGSSVRAGPGLCSASQPQHHAHCLSPRGWSIVSLYKSLLLNYW